MQFLGPDGRKVGLVEGTRFHDGEDLLQEFVAHSDQCLLSGFPFCSEAFIKILASWIGFHGIHGTHVQHVTQGLATTFTDSGLALNRGAAAVFCWAETCKAD